MANIKILRRDQRTVTIALTGSQIESEIVFDPLDIWYPSSDEIYSSAIDKISWSVTGSNSINLSFGTGTIGTFSGSGTLNYWEKYSTRNIDEPPYRGQITLTTTQDSWVIIIRIRKILVSADGGSYTFVNDFGETITVLLFNTLGTVDTVIDSVLLSEANVVKYTVQCSYPNSFQISEITLMHNGSTSDITEYGITHTSPSPLVTYTTDISGGNMRLLAAAAAGSTTTLVIQKNTIAV